MDGNRLLQRSLAGTSFYLGQSDPMYIGITHVFLAIHTAEQKK